MMKSKVVACFLCLTLSAGAARAQDVPANDSDSLKRKIEEVESAAPQSGTASVNLIYRRTLLRRYDQYVSSLRKDIEDLRKLRATLDGTDSDGLKEIDAGIERLSREHEAAAEKARSLRPEAQEEGATAQTTPSPTPTPGGKQLPCECRALEGNDKLPAGVIWCGKVKDVKNEKDTKNGLSVEKLVERAAPILWFSPDEPLRKKGQIPEKLPGDNEATSPVVYYRVSRLVLDTSTPISGKGEERKFRDEQDLDLTEIKEITLMYYFYYSDDKGFGGHEHDLESVRLDIRFNQIGDFKRSGDGYYVARIIRVIGAAHGVSWYENQLDVEEDTSLPITVFVEEGKHASCPDRNADGFYSPGYDVNRKFNDAWGVRDIIATGHLGVRYDGTMTKPRRPDDMLMVVPNAAKGDCLLSPYIGSNKEKLEAKLAAKEGYKLRRVKSELVTGVINAQQAKVKEAEKAVGAAKTDADRKSAGADKKSLEKSNERLIGFMTREKFDQDEPDKSRQTNIFKKGMKFGLGIERSENAPEALTVGYRFDGGHGFSFAPPVGRYQLPVYGGYVLPKANLILFGKDKRYSLEAMYTTSAARTFDWYVSAGSEWFRLQDRDFEAKFVSEGGVKFRFPYKRLFGARLGLRTTGRDPRVVFEFGAGAF